jgi:hypothetical protein
MTPPVAGGMVSEASGATRVLPRCLAIVVGWVWERSTLDGVP